MIQFIDNFDKIITTHNIKIDNAQNLNYKFNFTIYNIN